MPFLLSRKGLGMPIDYLPVLAVSRSRVNYNEIIKKIPSAPAGQVS